MATDATIDDTLAEAGLDPVSHFNTREPAPNTLDLYPGEIIASKEELARAAAEIQYWREHQACEIGALLGALERRAAPKAFLIERLANAYQGLKDALAGEYFETCEGCGRQIWPGEIEIPCTDVRCHADCSGKEGIKAGDHVKMPAESIEVEEGEAPRDYVVAFETTALFTAEQILERVHCAHDVLAQAGRV